jgi:hypothetical protein
MRATEFLEDKFGTAPKRIAREGSRPARGHEPVPRYKTQDIEEHKKGVKAVKYSKKPKKPVNPSDVHAKAKEKLNPPKKPAPKKVDAHLGEEGKASLKLCKSSKPDNELGASQLASCKSQGLRARDGNKSHKLGKSPNSRVKVGGHKIKGQKYGGPLPDWS